MNVPVDMKIVCVGGGGGGGGGSDIKLQNLVKCAHSRAHKHAHTHTHTESVSPNAVPYLFYN